MMPPSFLSHFKGSAACSITGICFAVPLGVYFQAIGVAVIAFPVMTGVYSTFYFHFRSYYRHLRSYFKFRIVIYSILNS